MKELTFDLETGKMINRKEFKEFSVIPVGDPIIISYKDNESGSDQDIRKIVHQEANYDGGKNGKRFADAYVLGGWCSNSWDNASFPSYSIVAVQYYRIISVVKITPRRCCYERN